MMTSRFVQIILAIATLSGLAFWLSSKHDSVPATENTSVAEQWPVQTATDTLAATPEARAYRERNDFERRTRAFLRDAPKLDENTRIERSRELSAEIDQREQTKEFSAGEAIMLRIGLIQATIDDDRERARQAQSLVDRYREQTEASVTSFLAQQRTDIRFQAYKAEESKIVSEVLAMQEYPNGMNQDDYLRMRLQEVREHIYELPIQEVATLAAVDRRADTPPPDPDFYTTRINPEKPPSRSTRVVAPADVLL
jgi:hypothetical protein